MRGTDLTRAPVTGQDKEGWGLSHSTSILRARHEAAYASHTVTSHSLKSLNVTVYHVENLKFSLKKLKSSHSLSLHGYLIRRHLTLYILVL